MPATLLAVVVTLHLPGFSGRVFNNDEAYIATVADVMAHGGRLYEAVVDRKPPGVFLLYRALAALTGSRALWIPRTAGMVAHASTATLVWVFARRRYGDRGALVAGLLAAITSVTVTPGDAQSAEFEVFMMPFVVGSMVLADRRRPAVAGLALGAATMMKQTAATTLLPLAWLAWRGARPTDDRPAGSGGPPDTLARLRLAVRRDRIGRLALLGAGAAAPVVLCAVLFGPGRFWFWVFGGANGGYLDVGDGGLPLVARRMVSMSGAVLLLNLGLVVLAVCARRTWRADADIWLWLLSAAVGVASGTRFFGHYYWQLFPPLCLLAGRAAATLPVHRVRIALGTAAATGAGAAIAAAALRLGGPSDDYQSLATYTRAHTAPDERIFVWGHEPALFLAADRLPASRVITTGFLTGHTAVRPDGFAGMDRAVPGLWDDVMVDLAAHPPALFFDLEPADPAAGADYPLSDYPPMAEFVAEHYRLADVIGEVSVYELVTEP